MQKMNGGRLIFVLAYSLGFHYIAWCSYFGAEIFLIFLAVAEEIMCFSALKRKQMQQENT